MATRINLAARSIAVAGLVTALTCAGAAGDGAATAVAANTVDADRGAAAGPGPARPDLSLSRSLDDRVGGQARAGHYGNTGHVGDVVAWPAYAGDGQDDHWYLKDFTLRGVGPHVEVWVARGDDVSTGLDYPAGDCRNGVRTSITNDQIAYLVDQYESVIRPRERAVFGSFTNRNGSDALLPARVPSVPRDAYRGPGDRLVVLVDNFREPGFMRPSSGAGTTYGLVSPFQLQLTDRNIVNLRGTDWAWHLGTRPQPDAPTHDPCSEEFSWRNMVEGVLAHEAVHVYQASAGSDEEQLVHDWHFLLEGVAAWAVHLTGYLDPAVNDERNSQVECYLGYLSVHATNYLHQCPGGPGNALVSWGDGDVSGPDYGAAESFMEFLDGRFGDEFLAAIADTVGVWGPAKIDRLLADRGIGTTFDQLRSNWQTAIALDGVLDDGAQLLGGDASRYQVPGLHAGVTWESPYAYTSPVVSDYVRQFGSDYLSTNGANYVRLRQQDGSWLDASALDSLDFNGQSRGACLWETDPEGHGSGDRTLYTGTGLNGQDKSIGRTVAVPTSDPSLDFDAKYDLEDGWDFGYVQVSTDGGETWQSIPATTTTSAHEAQAAASIVADLPGFTGDSGGWVHEHADLSQWSGRDVMIGFRYRTDALVTKGGFWVDDVTIGGDSISDGADLGAWQQLPPKVEHMDVRLVSYTDDHRVAAVADVPLDADNDAHLTGAELRPMVAPGAQTVAVIVTHRQHAEFPYCGAKYDLVVNGVPQTFGGPRP